MTGIWHFFLHRKVFLALGLLSIACVCGYIAQQACGQAPSSGETPTWEQAAGGAQNFEVASVRPDRRNGPSSLNVSPTAGTDFATTHGTYLSRNIVLVETIAFAYKLSNKQLQSVTEQYPWTAHDRFDIEARAPENTTKDQYRLMVQALLKERFGLRAHFESRIVPVFALEPAKAGQLGPMLRLHAANDPECAASGTSAPNPTSVDRQGFPELCGGPVGMKPSAPGLLHVGGRDVSLTVFATNIAGVGDVDRPIVDSTGLPGTVDYSLEWAKVQANLLPGESLPPEGTGPTFPQALREQMGLKLEPRKAPIEFFTIDHLEQPTAN